MQTMQNNANNDLVELSLFHSLCISELDALFLVVCLQISVWDSFMWWWGSEEVGAIRKRKKPIANRAIMKPKTKE